MSQERETTRDTTVKPDGGTTERETTTEKPIDKPVERETTREITRET